MLKEHPDWILTRDGAPVARIIERYGLDPFRIDYNTAIDEGGNRVCDGIVENTIWRQVEAICGPFARLRHALNLYKERFRPLLPDAKAIHHTPALPLFEPSPWCVLEYAVPDASRAVSGVFRLTGTADGTYRFRPRGLEVNGRYRVTFDNTGDSVEIGGLELQRDGIEVRLASPLTSELVFFDRV
jgi:hypothetical protein